MVKPPVFSDLSFFDNPQLYLQLLNSYFKIQLLADEPLYFNFNNLALTATITVLKLIKTAPIAGLNIKCGYNTPAAKGIATKL